MFRRLSSSLPEDPKFPADLEELGYFINDKDQIRSIANPDQEFNFFISKNDRANDVQREAMNTCIRETVLSRLTSHSLCILRLPPGSYATDPHIPILATHNLSTAKRIIVYFGEAVQDLAIFAYRLIGQQSLAAGSAISLLRLLQASIDDNSLGLVLANMGQLLWYRGGARAVTHGTWQALLRETAVAGPMRLDGRNRVRENEGLEAHVKCVFEEVVGKLAGCEAVVDVIGVGAGANEAPIYLDRRWEAWKGRVQAVVLGAPHTWVSEYRDERFREFLGKRGRAYLISKEPIDTPLSGRAQYGCNCYSSGEPLYSECIMPVAQERFLAYFDLVAKVPGYEEMEVPIPDLEGVVDPEDGSW
ncbi:Arb2 domain [Lasallia pustulata]|uniref:Arb2 domain n=1 Tax=Lasallia pustulata TaxID=136370 RepID=A0A1W5D5Z9_9LECA|nr:Arb2 domain [Lasallia pustulata]